MYSALCDISERSAVADKQELQQVIDDLNKSLVFLSTSVIASTFIDSCQHKYILSGDSEVFVNAIIDYMC